MIVMRELGFSSLYTLSSLDAAQIAPITSPPGAQYTQCGANLVQEDQLMPTCGSDMRIVTCLYVAQDTSLRERGHALGSLGSG